MTDTRHIILIGLPGVGKTTVGEALAKKLKRPFLDLDLEIERSTGMTIPEFFSERGEQAFRTAESVISQQLAESPLAPSVIAPGGGWIGNPNAVAHLRRVSRIIYLRVAPTGALERLGAGIERRPLFAQGTPADTMQRLFTTRRPLYEAAADETIDTDGATLEEVLQRVLNVLVGVSDTR